MVDVCVIGGGPAGMFSAYYAASRGLSVILIEGHHELGGRLHYFLDLPIYDIPAQFGITARHYLQQLQYQLEKSDAHVLKSTLVTHIERHEHAYHIVAGAHTIKAKTIIQATGNGFLRPKMLHKSYRYALHEPLPLQAHIAVIGATPTAADWALRLAALNAVTLFYDKPLTLQPMLLEPLQAIRTAPLQLAEAASVNGEAFDAIYCHIGSDVVTMKRPFRTLQQAQHGYFTAGDVHKAAGKIKLIHGATHDAMQAVNNAYQYIHKDNTYQPIVSTHHPIFKEWDL